MEDKTRQDSAAPSEPLSDLLETVIASFGAEESLSNLDFYHALRQQDRSIVPSWCAAPAPSGHVLVAVDTIPPDR